MNNIVAPTPTEGVGRDLVAPLRTLLATLVLGALLVTFTPFQDTVSDEIAQSGSMVNQLGYAALGAIALGAHLLFTDRRVALSLLRPVWIVMVLWLVFSSLQAPDVEGVLRTLAFTLAGMLAVTGALCLPVTVADFRLALATAVLAAIGLSYLGVLALPSVAIHQAVGPEAIHAGLWRGVYSHKNVAGAVMASYFFIGFYLLRCRWNVIGGLIAVASFVFVVQTGSKTSAALLPTVAILVMGGRLFGGRPLVVLVFLGALATLALATLGSVLFAPIDHLLQSVAPGTTFTGRTDIWRFAMSQMPNHLWTGFGVESFWRTGAALGAEPSRELAWDPRGTPNAHSGYLDIAISTGLPGLALAVIVLALMPLSDFMRTGRDAESRCLAELFLMMLVFGLMNSFLESYLFDRANPIWITLWIAVVGLHLLSRNRLAAPAGPGA